MLWMPIMTEPPSPAVLDLAVDGMTCASCVGRVERALRKVQGVAEVSVNLATERARVQLNEPVAQEVLIAALDHAGYTARLPAHTQADHARHERQRVRERWLMAMAVVLALPLIAPMLLQPFGMHWMLPPLAQFALATPVQFIIGARFYVSAYRALRARAGNMDLLVAIGTSAGYGLSLYQWSVATPGQPGHLYFESSAVVIALVMVGKYLETHAKRKTGDALRGLQNLRPTVATRLRDGAQESVAIEFLKPGDVVLVKPGERCAVDGVVLSGRSHADEALLTGESLPVPKQPGDRVTAGAINGEGVLQVETRATAGETLLARIIRLVEEAQSAKAPIQQQVDKVSQVFVPVIVLLAVATLLGWWFSGADVQTALLHGVSVLVIACPCALGLATPAAIMAGTGAAARHGILIKDAAALERASRIDCVVFDKTGTLTSGHPRLLHLATAPGAALSSAQLLADAGALQRGSEHPLARAVLQQCQAQQLILAEVSDSQTLPGRGVRGTLDGRKLLLGNQRLLADCGLEAGPLRVSAADWEAQGYSLAWLLEASPRPAVLGLLAFGDALKPGARQAVQRLHLQGMAVHLLTGDNHGSAARVAAELAIDPARVHAQVLPADKVAVVKALGAQQRVAMVGDGINDAPALASAAVGMAMGNGTDIALQAASITLMRGDPGSVEAALDICRRTYRKIRQNLFWAFIYNVIGIPLAILGVLDPVMAGAAMALSSVSVVLNALWLNTWKPPLAPPTSHFAGSP